jgi:very-short-patch-repair endonuclease
MSPTQLPLALAAPHANQQLFSDHYLNETLPQRPDWNMLAHDAGQALARITPIVEAFLRAPAQNEAQTEDDLVKPVLRALGHTFEIQANLATPDGTKKPDYVFYANQAAQDANKSVKVLDEAALAGKAFAIGDAKYWDRPLDVNLKTAGDPFSNKNPAYQIAFYIQHSGLQWGILTNGRKWRLYHRDTAYKQDRFYEVDLPALVAGGNASAFLYFFAFFRRAAFDDGPLGLAAILRESADYARGIGTTLRGQVYDALAHLAQGFLDYPANRLDASDRATLKTIYDNSLIVLYRLLFVLYAEARELLPIRANASYRLTYSLDAIKRDVARRMDGDAPLLASSTQLWNRLTELFAMIDRGEEQLGIATFNGGLFDPQRYPFLERNRVGDARLLAAIDKLARVEGAFIDYRDLAERHLGTIYEGLLEYHLETLTPQPPLPVPGEGVNWTVGLFNDRGERHRTGSYYTPDFVVQYIVEQTLRPILDAAVAGKTSDAEKIRAVLAVNCLDPAMGSGHFPAAATEYMARYLVDLGVTIDEGEQRTENRKDSLRAVSELRTTSSAPGSATTVNGSEFLVRGSEPDLAYWKRRVAQSCIYGVDLNPLAVDLAKLSLWLVTAARDRPLSFLDHHLRCGNALIGTRIADMEIKPQSAKPRQKTGYRRPGGSPLRDDTAEQASMLDDPEFARSMSTAVDSMWLIEASDGITIEQVKEQERLYAALRSDLTRRYERLADVATARDFGVEVDATLWRGLSDYLQRGGFEVPQYGKVLRAAAEYAEAQRFFHWDLEFPEVFFDRHGRPLGDAAGFDAVFGNPPYVRQEQLAPIKPYVQQAYPETYHGMADLYVYFYQQGIRLLRAGGRMSYIVTNKWMRAGYGEPLRAFFASESRIEQLIDFGHAPIFEDADVFPCIIVVEKPGDGSYGPHPPTPSPMRGEGERRLAGTAADRRGEGERGPAGTAADRRGEGEHLSEEDRWQIGDPLRTQMIAVARQFRKQPTPSEALLWQALRGQRLDGRKFRRQQPIGPFIVDFFCPSERLIVEVDGPIHNQQHDADRQRQHLLEGLGLRFVRVTADAVETNLDAVLATIRAAFLPIAATSPTTSPPLPFWERGPGGEGAQGPGGEHYVQVTAFPREALKLVQLDGYVKRFSHPVPQSRLGSAPWSLEASDVDQLMEKIRRAGVPLAEFAGVKPYRGVLTGFNEAFLIDTATRERLVREDPRSAEIIKPYLRGQDIKRWSPEWDGLWMIFARRGIDIDLYPAVKVHLAQFREQLEPRPRDWSGGTWKGRKPGPYKWYEIQDSVDYWRLFERTKIIWKDLSSYSEFCIDRGEFFTNDLCFILETKDLWLLAALNSPIVWYYLSRATIHGINETLRLKNIYTEQLPIAPPSDDTRAEVEPAVERLIAITQADQEARRDTLEWLRAEFGIAKPGQKLEAFASLDQTTFIEEVRKRRPRSAGTLSPSGLRALRDGYAEQAHPVQERQTEARTLERRLSDLVNAAYGLTPEDIELLWRTAPPRMPVGRF